MGPGRRRPGRGPWAGRPVASLLGRGLRAFYREDEEGALRLFLKSLRLEPEDIRAHYLVALCAHLLSQELTLEETCSRALKLSPRHPYTTACEAVRYLSLSNFSRAETLFIRALEERPGDLELLTGLGILYEYSGDQDKGRDAFARVLGIDPDNVRARVALGMFYAMDGEFETALAEYRRARELDPEVENPYQRLGRDYYYEGMVEQAAAEFARALGEEPDQPAPYFYLLDCYRRLGRADDALDTYREIGRRFGQEPELTSGLYEQFNMRPEAIAALEDLSERIPRDYRTLHRLSAAYRDDGRLGDAARVAEKLIKLAPDRPEGLALLGDVCFRREQYALAATYCQRAVELDPNAQAAYTTLADALLFLGRQDESCRVIQNMEQVRKEAWRRYQAKFSGEDRADVGL